jgi:hypothetical protein
VQSYFLIKKYDCTGSSLAPVPGPLCRLRQAVKKRKKRKNRQCGRQNKLQNLRPDIPL